jgi:hypothetical protein
MVVPQNPIDERRLLASRHLNAFNWPISRSKHEKVCRSGILKFFHAALSDHAITARVMAAADKSKFAADL